MVDITPEVVLAPPLWRASDRTCRAVLGGGRSPEKNFSVMRTNMQFLTKKQHIITKFSSQVSIYTYENFIGGRDWGAVSPLTPPQPPMNVTTVIRHRYMTSYRPAKRCVLHPPPMVNRRGNTVQPPTEWYRPVDGSQHIALCLPKP